MTGVLLSASIPSNDERGAAVRPYFPGDIFAAAAAVIEAVLRSGADLVYGGHPTISPVVLQIAGLLRAGPQVHVWQSDLFEDQVTDDVRRLIDEEGAHAHQVPAVNGDRGDSLALMRHQMLDQHELAAAFFVGGMDGIAAEIDVLARVKPHVPFYAFVTPGGMAAQISGDPQPSRASATPRHDARGKALEGRAYGSLAVSALAEVGLHPRPGSGEV